MTLISLLLIIGASVTLGFFVVQPLFKETVNPAITIAAGLGTLSLLLGCIALAGWFRISPFVIGGLAVLSCPILFHARRRRFIVLSWTETMAVGLLLFAAATAIAPVTEDDSLAYPIPIARHLAAEGQWRFWPDQWRSVFPLSQELLVAILLQFGSERLGMISAMELLLSALLMIDLGRKFNLAPHANAVALLITFGAPAAVFLGASAKEDLLLVLMTLAALYTLVEFDRGKAKVIAVGLFAGFAAGAKYPGLVIAVAAIGGVAIVSQHRFRDTTVASLWAVVTGGLWYGMNAIRFGNPLPPFLSPPLPTFLSPNALVGARAVLSSEPFAIYEFLYAPIIMFLSPELAGGRGNMLNPLCWIGYVGLLSPSLRRRYVLPYWMAIFFYVVWFFSTEIARLLLPMATLMALPATEVLLILWNRWKIVRPLVMLLLICSGGCIVLIAGVRIDRFVSRPADFLSRETQNYDDLQWMNRHLDPRQNRVATTFKACGYLKIPWINLAPSYQAEIMPEEMLDPKTFLTALRRQRITHLYVGKNEMEVLAPQLVLIHENPSSRLGGKRLLHDPPTVATAIYEIPSPN